MTNETLHISLIQSDLFWEDADKNCSHFEELFAELPVETELVVLPEMFSTGFSMQVEKCAEQMDGLTVEWMRSQAQKQNIAICGSVMIKENAAFYNRFVFAHPDGKLEQYDKRHLFSMGEEHLHFTPGKERKIIQYKSFRILPQVCYDLRFPVFSRNLQDYDLMINVANWPAPRREVWQTLLKARSIENQAFVAGVNRIGTDGIGINYSGDSAIIDPKGKIMAEAIGKKEQLISAKLDKGSLERFRLKFPVLPDGDQFQLQ